jgi:hypothetical protein
MNFHDMNILGTLTCLEELNLPVWEASHEGRLVYISSIDTFYFADSNKYNIIRAFKGSHHRDLLNPIDYNLNSNFCIYPDSTSLIYKTELLYIFDYIDQIPCYNIKNPNFSLYNIFTLSKIFLFNNDFNFYILYSTITEHTKIFIDIEIYSSIDFFNNPIKTYLNIELVPTEINKISIVCLNMFIANIDKLPITFGIKISKSNDIYSGNIKILDVFLRQNNIRFDIFNSNAKIKELVNINDIIYISNNDNGYLFLTSNFPNDSIINIILPSPFIGSFFSIKKDKNVKTINIDYLNNIVSNSTINDESIISFIATGLHSYQIKSRSSEWNIKT